MASIDWSCLKGCWARIIHPFIIWNLKDLLFLLGKAGKPRNPHCSSNRVNSRTWPMVKSWYAYYRSFHAGCNEIWIVKYVWVLREIHWFKVWLSNVVLLVSSIWVWIRLNHCWIVDVRDEMNTVICRLSIFVKIHSWLEIWKKCWRTRLEP